MNKFKIENMRFRILKGGKIGLAASIAIIGGVLTFSSVSANATNYFTYTGVTTFTDGGASATSYSNTGVTTLNRTNTDVSDNVVFNPIGVQRTYVGVDGLNDGGTSGSTSTNYFYWDINNNDSCESGDTCDRLNYSDGITLTSGEYTITFNSGSSANNITKNLGNNIDVVTGFNTNVNRNYGYTNVGSFDYTANLIFSGTNTVSGYTDIDAGKIDINGGVTFAGTVQAGSIDINTSSLVTFNSAVDLSPGTIDALTFNNGGEVRLNNGLTGNVDFNGQNAKVVLSSGNISGTVDTSTAGSGTLSFTTNGNSTVTGDIGATESLKEISIDGTGTMSASSNVNTNLVTFNSAGEFIVTGDLDTTKADDSIGNVIFNEVDASLEIGGDLTAQVSTVNNNQGSVTMTGGTQTLTGGFGDYSKKIARLNIQSGSQTTSNTSIYATRVTLNSDSNNSSTSSLTMTEGSDIYSTIVTGIDNTGTLTFNGVGEYQDISDQIGTNDKKLAIINSGANNISDNDVTQTRFNGDVYAYTLNNTGTGTTEFRSNFTGTTLNFLGDGEVWLDDNKTINADIKTYQNNKGTLTFEKNATMSGDIGEDGAALKTVYIGENYYSGTVTADNIFAETIVIDDAIYSNYNVSGDSILRMNQDKNINGNVTLVENNTGILDLKAGGNTVNGNIGTSVNAIKSIEAGTTNTITTINGMVNAQALNFDGNGTVILNGDSNANGNIEGMVGTVNLNNNTGTLEIGDDVNLTTVSGLESDTNGIQFESANDASLVFNGSSTVTGVLGGDTDGRSTFETISAGADSKTVTFKDDVYVEESSPVPTTFHVSGTGTVNFEGDLYGDLVFDANGAVNVSHTKSIITTTAPLAVYTGANNQGTLNFLGSTTLYTDIGASGGLLNAVNFNNDTLSSTQNINKNIYATTTTIGGTSDTTALALTDVSGTYDYAGGNTINEFTTGGTIANITEDITFGGNLVLENANTAVNFGTSQITVAGYLSTSDAGMSFIVNTNDITGIDNASSTSTGSALVQANTLSMTGDEKIHINYVGSLADNGTYTLIDTTSNTAGVLYNENEDNGLVSDNSFSIDTTVAHDLTLSSLDDTGDLILYADRTSNDSHDANELYIIKSDTSGHFSNNAAKIIAGIAADGSQTDDMIEVIQKLELDSFGFGNNEENLAVQVKKLAPIVNTSFVQTSVAATNQVTNSIGSRVSDTRGLSSGEALANVGVWGKITGSSASQDSVGQYDGYSLASGGAVFGIDKELNNGLIFGMAGGFTYTKTEQDDFRSGDSADTNSYQVSLYASKEYKNAFVDGSVSYTKHNTEGTRTTAIDRMASYDIDTNQLSAKINGGYNFNVDGIILTPFASLEYSRISQDDYKETGAGSLNLSVDDISVNRTSAGLGLKVAKEIKTDSISFTPELKIGAKKYFGDDNVEVTAQFEQGDKFVTRGSDMIDLTYNAGLGLTTQLSDSTDISLSSDYERSSDGDFQGVNGQLTFRMQF